jgi:hypothetical protein
MNWPLTNPGSADLAGIRQFARLRAERATTLREVSAELRDVLQLAQSGEWVSAAQVAFIAKTESVLPDLETLFTGEDAQASALNDYATVVGNIQDALLVLHSLQRNATTHIERSFHSMPAVPASHTAHYATLDLSWNRTEKSMAPEGQRAFAEDSPDEAARRSICWSDFDIASTQLHQCDKQLGELVNQRRTADAVCAAALSSQQVLGRLAAVTPARVAALSKSQLLSLMEVLSAGDLHILLTQNPSLAQQFWDSPPAASEVAIWWNSLSPAEKMALETGAAAIIGNLGGVDYVSRIRANGHQLDEYKKRAGLTDTQRDAIKEIDKVVGGSTGAVGALVDFNVSDDPPLAAFAFGNLDTVEKATWAIPGMNSKVATDDTWSQAAQNLRKAQDDSEPGTTHGVVAWLGYRSPTLGDSLDYAGSSASVWENNLAMAGSKRLTAELDAFHDTLRTATDGEPIVPRVSVVAHSYGTTTAAYALRDIHFDVLSAVLVASAGIDEAVVPNGAAMRIAIVDGREQLYSTQTSTDSIATVGRMPASWIPSASAFVGPIFTQYPDSHRVNPDKSFGAIRFGSEGGTAGGQTYAAGGGHDAIGAGGIGASIGHGYFDLNTESLHDAVLASTGNGSSIEALTPFPHARTVHY